MYSEPQRRPATNRANDEFLRRMLGGELTEGVISVLNLQGGEAHGPSCDGTTEQDANACGIGECPTCIHAPSLAMVYCPTQCWRNVLQPEAALACGSLFAELVMPLEAASKNRGMEVRNRK